MHSLDIDTSSTPSINAHVRTHARTHVRTHTHTHTHTRPCASRCPTSCVSSAGLFVLAYVPMHVMLSFPLTPITHHVVQRCRWSETTVDGRGVMFLFWFFFVFLIFLFTVDCMSYCKLIPKFSLLIEDLIKNICITSGFSKWFPLRVLSESCFRGIVFII